MLSAIEYCLALNIDSIIYSDSLYVVNLCNNGIRKINKNKDLVTRIFSVIDESKMSLQITTLTKH